MMSSDHVDFSRFRLDHVEEGYEEETNFSSGWVKVSDDVSGISVLMSYSNFSDVYFDVDAEGILYYAFRARDDYENGRWDNDENVLKELSNLSFALEVLLNDELSLYRDYFRNW